MYSVWVYLSKAFFGSQVCLSCCRISIKNEALSRSNQIPNNNLETLYTVAGPVGYAWWTPQVGVNKINLFASACVSPKQD